MQVSRASQRQQQQQQPPQHLSRQPQHLKRLSGGCKLVASSNYEQHWSGAERMIGRASLHDSSDDDVNKQLNNNNNSKFVMTEERVTTLSRVASMRVCAVPALAANDEAEDDQRAMLRARRCNEPPSRSTFAAADVRRTLALGLPLARHIVGSESPLYVNCSTLSQQQQQQQQLSSRSSARNASLVQRRQHQANATTHATGRAFKVHARHKSIGQVGEFAVCVTGDDDDNDDDQATSLEQLSPQPEQQFEQPRETSTAPRHSATGQQHQPNNDRVSSTKQQDNCSDMNETYQTYTLDREPPRPIGLGPAGSIVSVMSGAVGPTPDSGGPAASGDAERAQRSLANPAKLTRLVGKKAARVKEIVLQSLGKAERTTDDMFQMYEDNFYKQQAHAHKLHKDFKAYVGAVHGAHDAGKSLYASMQASVRGGATGEEYPLRARHELACNNLSQIEHLNEDLIDKMRNQIMSSIVEHLNHFGELRDKIAKRRRKLIDYDSSRRLYELMLANVNKKRELRAQQQQLDNENHVASSYVGGQLRSFRFIGLGERVASAALPAQTHAHSAHEEPASMVSASQLVDEARLLKLREQYNYCKIMYETINAELLEELPSLYEQKMRHLLATLQSFFSLEAQYHAEAGKLFATAGDLVDELNPLITSYGAATDADVAAEAHDEQQDERETASAKQTAQVVTAASSGSSSGMGSSRGESSADHSSASSSASPEHDVDAAVADSPLPDECVANDAKQPEVEHEGTKEEEPQEIVQGNDQSAAVDQIDGNNLVASALSGSCVDEDVAGKQADVSDDECLYKVKTLYKYVAEDVDELCFEADEIVKVIKFDDCTEPEDGWLLGVRESNGQRGLFPANFTQPM